VAPAGYGIPGADYEGYLDPLLKVSDYVVLGGSAQWYDTLSGFTQTGFIGIDNRQGTSPLYGTLSIRLDNTPDPNDFKHLWAETDVRGLGGSLSLGVQSPPDNLSWSRPYADSYSIGDGFYRFDYGFTKSPNPVEETVVYTFHAEPGGFILFDNIHIATECVPEPGTMSLLLLGAVGFVVLRLRRKAA
jgi:hypothetical protein